MIDHDLGDFIRREIARAVSQLVHPRPALVTSYDPDQHAVKLQHQPDGNESGWSPIQVASAGNGISIVHGPTPGDQAHVSFLDGDIESPVVTGFLHSDVDRPPRVESGETMIVHKKDGKTLSTVKFDKDGHISIDTQKKNVSINTNGGDLNLNTAGGNVNHSTDGNYTLNVKGHYAIKVGSISVDKG